MSAPVVAMAALVLLGAAPALEKPAKYVTDKAGVIPADRLSALNEDRAMRVEVGYGLEGAIPDAIARRITSEVVRPLFKKGDYAGGIEAGARALMSAARGEGYTRTGRTAAETPAATAPLEAWTLAPTFLAGLLPLLTGLFRRRTTGRSVAGILASACLVASIAAFVTAAVTTHPLLWALAFLLLVASFGLGIASFVLSAPGSRARPTRASRRSSSRDGYASSASDSDSSSSSSSDSSSDSSSSSSSDFSGGGGDSGGGGSSDNW